MTCAQFITFLLSCPCSQRYFFYAFNTPNIRENQLLLLVRYEMSALSKKNILKWTFNTSIICIVLLLVCVTFNKIMKKQLTTWTLSVSFAFFQLFTQQCSDALIIHLPFQNSLLSHPLSFCTPDLALLVSHLRMNKNHSDKPIVFAGHSHTWCENRKNKKPEHRERKKDNSIFTSNIRTVGP